MLPATGGVWVASLFGSYGEVETTDGVEGGVDLGAVVRRSDTGYFYILTRHGLRIDAAVAIVAAKRSSPTLLRSATVTP